MSVSLSQMDISPGVNWKNFETEIAIIVYLLLSSVRNPIRAGEMTR